MLEHLLAAELQTPSVDRPTGSWGMPDLSLGPELTEEPLGQLLSWGSKDRVHASEGVPAQPRS